MTQEAKWPHPESVAHLPQGWYVAWAVATDLPQVDHSPGRSACAWLIQAADLEEGAQKEAKRSREDHSDKQRAAACAVIGLIESMAPHSAIIIRCASQYVVNAVNKDASRWRKGYWRNAKGRQVKNVDVWSHYLAVRESRHLDVTAVQWPRDEDAAVKEMLMQLARSARDA